MNPFLRNLLITVGVLGGGTVVYTTAVGVTPADMANRNPVPFIPATYDEDGGLLDAGRTFDPGNPTGWIFADHPVVQIQASIVVDKAPECNQLPDGGVRKSQYWTRNFNIRWMDDGSMFMDPPNPGNPDAGWRKSDGSPCFTFLTPDSWRMNTDGSLPEQHWCACRSWDAGVCNINRPNLPDGGEDLFPDGGHRRMTGKMKTNFSESLNPAGPACVRMPCIELLGQTAWPDECGDQQ